MLGAHLDGAQEGPGINDNGTGSAAILETAVQLAKVNKLNNTVRFAWWSGEEDGLQGSNAWVADQTQAQLDTIATYLNFDMVGSPNYIIGVYDADQSTYTAPVTVPEGSSATESVFTDYFDSLGQPWVDTEFSGRSDYQAFILNGVPASGLFTGADGTKTPAQEELFGGTAGITYDPNYHTAGDTIDNVDREALDIMSDAIAHAALALAQDTSEINGKRSAGKSGKPHPQEQRMMSEEAAA
jgi:Zn-dependent M28 family amino/carboxypeptidase